VMVAEGPGHRRDTLAVYEESGLADVLTEDHIQFHDLNYITGHTITNLGRQSTLRTLTFPALFLEVDWIVSVAKMKTHHWAGATLSMKNLFGVMPGIYYGWPKNVLHHAGIENSILDINATLKPHFAIVDGIIGMEGDGPIMGTPKKAGVLVMGRNLTAVDATCCRIMGIDPSKVSYLARADDWLGPIDERSCSQPSVISYPSWLFLHPVNFRRRRIAPQRDFPTSGPFRLWSTGDLLRGAGGDIDLPCRPAGLAQDFQEYNSLPALSNFAPV